MLAYLLKKCRELLHSGCLFLREEEEVALAGVHLSVLYLLASPCVAFGPYEKSRCRGKSHGAHRIGRPDDGFN
jgi:hypothetical protein